MRIAVLVKQVPDSWAQKQLTSDGLLDRNVDNVLNDLDEYAIEAALSLRVEDQDSVDALCMGPESAVDAVRRALAMGADAGVMVSDAEPSRTPTASS